MRAALRGGAVRAPLARDCPVERDNHQTAARRSRCETGAAAGWVVPLNRTTIRSRGWGLERAAAPAPFRPADPDVSLSCLPIYACLNTSSAASHTVVELLVNVALGVLPWLTSSSSAASSMSEVFETFTRDAKPEPVPMVSPNPESA